MAPLVLIFHGIPPIPRAHRDDVRRSALARAVQSTIDLTSIPASVDVRQRQRDDERAAPAKARPIAEATTCHHKESLG